MYDIFATDADSRKQWKEFHYFAMVNIILYLKETLMCVWVMQTLNLSLFVVRTLKATHSVPMVPGVATSSP